MSADPITLAAAGVSTLGGGLEAAGQYQAARAAAEDQKYAANLAQRDGVIATRMAAFEEERIAREAERLLGAQRAAAGASGGTHSGSILELLAETAREEALDKLVLQFGTNETVNRLNAQSGFLRSGAAATKRAGTIAAFSSLLGGASKSAQLLGSAE